MAYIENDDKLLENQDQQNQLYTGGGGTTGGGNLNVSGGSTTDVGANQQSAGVSGRGGTSSWTNIQDYIKANNVDTGAAGDITSKVGGEFQKERDNISNQANALVDKAKQDVGTLWSEQDAQGRVDQASKDYRWQMNDAQKNFDNYYKNYYGGPNSLGYKNSYWSKTPFGEVSPEYASQVSSVKDYLGRQYTGPREFTYAIGDQSNKYADTLRSDDAFNQYMGDYYAGKAKAPLSGGQRALQTQLNVSNDSLNSMREKLLKDYSGVGEFRDQTARDTSSKLSGLENDMRVNQNRISDYLRSQAAAADTSEQSAEAKYRADRTALQQRQSPGLDYLNGRYSGGTFESGRQVGQSDRARYNAILDFLGSGDPRKQAGYDATNGSGPGSDVMQYTGTRYSDMYPGKGPSWAEYMGL